ncbi:4-hydroxy-3-methylbut-2-enyl diphosphate reductase [Candidatus Omnitrophota bacterium]
MEKKQLKIRKARCAGFCFGVKRAVGIAEDLLKKSERAYSLGSIIHNPVVVNDLSKRGLKVIRDIDKAKGSDMLIRSHGISPRLKECARKLSIRMIDATCPFVKRSHDIVSILKNEGYKIIIIGERTHPEISALYEVAGKDAVIVSKSSDLVKLKIKNKKVGAVAQTTLSKDEFLEIAHSILKSGCFEYRIFDTICNDVVQRQKEAKEIAKTSDVILVVGGKMSANTKHLASICKKTGATTHHIETSKEIRPPWFKKAESVGVVSGASTPAQIVDDVILKLKSIR